MKGKTPERKVASNGGEDHNLLTRRDFILASSGLMVGATMPTGCGGDKAESAAKKVESVARGTKWEGTQNLVNLAESAHLADINHFGEFIDFGTAARYKYTLGGWMSGWDNDTFMNGSSFTWASKSPSRIYFSLFKKNPVTIVIRAKKSGTDTFSVYLNDKPLSRVRLASNDFEEHRITAGLDAVVLGENYLKLVYKSSEKMVGGSPASFQIDYIRIIPDGADIPKGKQFDPPHLAALRQMYKADGKEWDSLMIGVPTKLSYYLDIQKGAKLCFAAAMVARTGTEKKQSVGLKVRLSPVDGGAPKKIFQKFYNDNKWHEEVIPLDHVEDKTAKLDIIVSGPPSGTRLALGSPSIRMAPPKIQATQKKIRNAVVVLIDTLRADKLTAYAKTRVRTPALDKFAVESTLFEQCQAPSNWTKPSCATVLTGLYPDTHKARGHASKVVSSIKLASEIFRAGGFATGAFIANGYLAGEFGFKRGWTEYVNFIRENKNTEAENVFKTSLDFIKNNRDKPFYTYIQTIDPHVPYDPPAEDLKLYDAKQYTGPVQNRSTGNLLEEFKRKKVELNAQDRHRLESLYDGEITYHDRHFGRFLDELNKLGVLDETAIIVCSDHGEEFFEHDSVGHGHTLYQELLHVPLVMRAPGVVPGNKRLKVDVGLADILPTLLEATGIPTPKGMEGNSLISLSNGALPDPLGAAFASFYSEADGRNLSWTVRKGKFKMMMRGPARTYIYNLEMDPRERTDVDTQFPLALRALRISLGQFIGAPDKSAWASGQLATQVIATPKGSNEEASMPDDLKQQLRALGYMQ